MRSLSRTDFLWTVVYRVASCGWAMLIAACFLAPLTADDRRSGAQRVVLLKNDRCLTGVVRHLGETVVVEIDSDARVSKPASEVLTIADDMQGIYQYKVSRYTRLGPGEHIRLARWCLSVDLHAEAAHHFLAVNKEAGDHAVVKQLGIELREHLLADDGFRKYLGLAPIASVAPEGTPIQLVSTSGQADLRPIVPAVVASFTEHVQPILLNRCSQSGCHGLSATNTLRLLQPLGSARARISEQNCRSALPFVEVDTSNMSQLQRYAVTAHGTQKTPAVTAQETRLIEVLQSWTTFARNPVIAAVNAAPAGSPGAVARAVYQGQVSPQAERAAVVPAGMVKPQGAAPRKGSPAGPTESELDALDDEVRRALGEPPRIPKGATPDLQRDVPNRLPAQPEKAASMTPPAKDPFDPAEFNRRVGAKTSP